MVRVPGAIALALLLALGICASSASAAPLSMTFTEGRANVGVQLSDHALFEAPKTAPFGAQIDPGSGAITAGTLGVPEFFTQITEPTVADVTVDFEIGEIEGSFDQATGALTLEGEAGGTLTAQSGTYEGEQCTVSTTPEVLELSTAESAGGAPRAGAPFAAGLTGSGAIAGQWSDMQATPVSGDADNISFCNNVETRIGGQGGVWLEQDDLVPPASPQLVTTDPAPPGGLSGTPRILGAAEAGSTVRVYADAKCTGTPIATGSAAELGSPGITVSVAEGATGTFTATATDAAGNTSACSASISYTRIHGDPPPTPVCVVPKLAGKTLARAKTALKNAGCAVGEVTKPQARKGKKRGPLVVKSSKPSAGKVLEVGSRVDLRLGRKPRKARY